MILAHIITRHMREVVRSYAQSLTLLTGSNSAK